MKGWKNDGVITGWYSFWRLRAVLRDREAGFVREPGGVLLRCRKETQVACIDGIIRVLFARAGFSKKDKPDCRE